MRSMPARLVTADQLLRLPRGRHRHELMRGELRTMSPANPLPCKIAARFGKILMNHVDQHRLGDVYVSEPGFLLEHNPDTVMAPDVAFVAANRTHLVPEHGFFPGPPDLAVEVRSPGDSAVELRAKAAAWLDHGCLLVVTVDPGPRMVVVYRRGTEPVELTEQATLVAGDVVPGFSMAIADLFAR